MLYMIHSNVLYVARASFVGLFFIAFDNMICHNGHQLFGIGYLLKIFRSQVAAEKKVNFTPCEKQVITNSVAEITTLPPAGKLLNIYLLFESKKGNLPLTNKWKGICAGND